MVKVKLPQILRRFSENKYETEIEAKTVKELIEKLDEKYQGIKNIVCNENGEVKRFVNIFVNNEDIRFLEGLDTALKDGDEVAIIPAIAGGNEN